MRPKFFTLLFLLCCAACTTPQAPITPEAIFNPTFTLPTVTAAPATITIRERFALRDLPDVGRNPIAIAALEGKVYVVNSTTNNVAVIQDNRVVKFIPVGKTPIAIALDAAQKRLYVSNSADKTISVIVNDQVTATQSIGDEARALLFSDNRLFAGLSSKPTLLALDPASLQTQAATTIFNAFTIINLAGDPVHHRLYANVLDRTIVLDSASLRVLNTIPIKGSYATLAAHSPSDSVLVAAYETETQSQFLGAYDAVSGKERGRVKIGGDPRGTALSADGARLYIANSYSRDVSVVDPRDLRVIATIQVALAPIALALDESARRLYVANEASDSVSLIDTDTNQLVATIPLGMRPTALVANERAGRVYIANGSSDSVFVVEGARVVKELGVGRHPIDLARDAASNRVFVANQADERLSIIDESDFTVRSTQAITRFLSTVAFDSKSRILAGDLILDSGTLNPTARLAMRGFTLGSTITPTFVRVNSNNNRIYAFGGNGIPGSNGRIVTYSVDGSTLQQRTILPGNGNSQFIEIDPETNRVYLAESHPLALTNHFTAFDADDNKIISFLLPARTTGMAYNLQTHHLFLAHASSATRAGQPTPADNTIQVLDATTFGEVARLSLNAPGRMTRLGNTIYVTSEDGTVTLIHDAVLPAPPAPTPTFTPSPFPSPTPGAISRAATVVIVRPTNTPRANLNCTISLGSSFTQKWVGDLTARLSCPSESARAVNFVMEIFERGRMFYREDEKRIYVMTDDKSWVAFDDRWTNALPEDSCPSFTVATWNLRPRRGFGKVWCENESVRAKIGAATLPEQGPYAATVQRFEHGLMFGGPESGVTWALVDGGRWE